MGIQDHLTCLLRNLYADQKQQLELDVEKQLIPNRKRSTSRLYIVILLFNLYAEYIMRNAGREET